MSREAPPAGSGVGQTMHILVKIRNSSTMKKLSRQCIHRRNTFLKEVAMAKRMRQRSADASPNLGYSSSSLSQSNRFGVEFETRFLQALNKFRHRFAHMIVERNSNHTTHVGGQFHITFHQDSAPFPR